MAFLSPKTTNENVESAEKQPAITEQPKKKVEKIRLSKLDDLGLCPHKAFPSKPIDRNKFENHNQYLEFLTQLKSFGKPWFIPPPTISKKKLKLKQMQITNVHPLKKKAVNKDKEMPLEDLSKYLVLQNTCENMKTRKKKKKTKLFKSGVGYSITVTDDLAFLLRTMADAREHLVQKAIENKWREEEEERKAKEKGDIQGLRNIVEGMMIKFIKIEEERLEMRAKQSSDAEKNQIKRKISDESSKRKISDESSKRKISDESSRKSADVLEPRSDRNPADLTKDLVGFLKSLLDADNKRKETPHEEKDTSMTDLDQFVQMCNEEGKLEEAKQEEIVEEEEEKEAGEEAEEKKEEEEKQDDETGDKVDNENRKTDEDNKEKEGGDGNEANVDLNEVNRKLEDLAAEGAENEEKQDEEEEEVEEEVDEWVKTLVSPRPSPKMKAEVSTQFDYFLERKLALGIKHEPKDVTEDLTVFLKTMMMADSTIRDIIKEKELKEYWKKIENFNSWAGGTQQQDCKCSRKCCQEAAKKNNKQDKNKATYKCTKKSRKCSSKRKVKKGADNSDSIELENGYCLQPNEFLMLLQGVYNTLTLAGEIDEDRKQQEEETNSEEDFSAFENSFMEPSLLVQLTDYINEARSVIEGEVVVENQEEKKN